MQFKKLRLAGFKSFVEPTELWIEPGLTGVVGPNGCGKSNLLEALRWVMGESRPKSLRGGGMEDVIFAGTDSRPKRNLADVTLTIDNSSRTAPAQFNDSTDLEVSRRIERDLGSLYRINGRDVRQKDVQLLFADAATGATSPALVSQGRVGALINAKPQDRRKLLEDAAGISGLHTRRNEAESKLRSASANLERLDDVLMRMDGQANALRRQAKQAVRYRTLSELIRQLEAQLLFSEWRTQSNLLETVRANLRAAEAEVGQTSRVAAQCSAEQAKIAASLPDLRQAEVEAAAALSRLQLKAQSLDEEKARLETLKQDLERRLGDVDMDAQRQAEYAADAQGALEQLDADLARLSKAMAGDDDAADRCKTALEAAHEEASKAEHILDEQSERIASARAYEGTAQRALSLAQTGLDRAKRELEQQHDIDRQLSAEAEAGGALAEAQSAVKDSDTALEECQTRLAATEDAQDRAQADLRAAQNAADEAETALKRLDSEIGGTKAALEADKRSDDGTPLADILSIGQGLELALGAAMGDGLDLPLDEGTRHWQAAPAQNDDPELPAGLKPLSSFVRGTHHIGRRLSQTGIADSHEDAQARAGDLRVGQQIVTRDGALWRWDGLRATAEAPSRASLRLRQRNHLVSLEGQRPDLQKAVTAAQTTLTDATQTQRSARQAREAARSALQQATRAAQNTRHQLRQIEQSTRALADKLSASAAKLEAKTEAVSLAQDILKDAQRAVDELPDLSRQDAAREAQRKSVEEKRATLSNARAAHGSQLAAARGRQNAYDRAEKERRQWLERVDKASNQAETLKTRRTEITQALKDLEARPAQITAQAQQLIESLEAGEAKRIAAADTLAEKENAMVQAQEALSRAQEAASQARETRARLEAETQGIEERRNDVIDRCQGQFGRSPSALLELCGVEDEADIDGPDMLSQAIEKRKLERERLGAVNLRADIELSELEGEAQDLRDQKEELESAIARLRGAIGSLNREGRERLMKAFDAVNDHFSKLFETLFGGGTAYITLIESDDPLEAGLEIMASPPGKKLQSLSLLSGGEQALTALSLIFAVFLTNPSPICVLDEVDAPLDDVNVERFCALLDEMVDITQTRFLIVTHNALTMSRMHRLFGVTMAERGVSQLVSVDLSQAETLVAAE